MYLTQADISAAAFISSYILGWSDERQYRFFKFILAGRPNLKDFLMLGVYHGRDIAFIQDILARYHPGRVLNIVGVDRFTAERCADWPHKAVSWEQLTKGMRPPSLESAQANVGAPNVRLVKMDDAAYLNACPDQYDAVYVDTSHDYKSVKGLLQIVKRVCHPDAIVCGDDYSDRNGWGVATAVGESFTGFALHDDWIWCADVSRLK